MCSNILCAFNPPCFLVLFYFFTFLDAFVKLGLWNRKALPCDFCTLHCYQVRIKPSPSSLVTRLRTVPPCCNINHKPEAYQTPFSHTHTIFQIWQSWPLAWYVFKALNRNTTYYYYFNEKTILTFTLHLVI